MRSEGVVDGLGERDEAVARRGKAGWCRDGYRKAVQEQAVAGGV